MLLINLLKRALIVASALQSESILALFLLPMLKNILPSLVLLALPLYAIAQNVPPTINDTLSIDSAEQSLKQAKASDDDRKIAESLFRLGQLNLSKSKIKALDYFKDANVLIEGTDHPMQQDLYFEQSRIYTTFSEFPEALNLGLQSLEFNKLNRIDKKILRDMSHIGYVYDRMYEFRKSIDYNKEALKIARRIDDKRGEALCLGRIGIAYDELAEIDNFNQILFDSALYYNTKAAELSELNNDLAFARTTYSNIGNTYSKLKQYDKAEEYTLKSLSVPGYEDKKGVTLVNLGKIYLETNRYGEAKRILDSAMQNTIRYGTRKYQLEAFYRFHELDVKQGNYKSALSNYIEYKGIEDSLLNETKTKQIAEVSERFKTAEKEREILIQRTELAEQHLIIQKRNYQLIAAIATFLILAALAYLLFNQQKLRNRQLRKENELRDALVKIETQNKLQEQRLRISRDLHDNIGSHLTFITSSLDNLKYNFELPENLQTKILDIRVFTSSTINQLRDTIWAMNKEEISLEDLEIRIQEFLNRAKSSTDLIKFNFNNNVENKDTIIFSSLAGINAYRIIQESVNNAIKYAKADEISVNISNNTNLLTIEIEDDGQGFDLEEAKWGNGIGNMKLRASEVDADIKIEASKGNGTKIKIVLDTH